MLNTTNMLYKHTIRTTMIIQWGCSQTNDKDYHDYPSGVVPTQTRRTTMTIQVGCSYTYDMDYHDYAKGLFLYGSTFLLQIARGLDSSIFFSLHNI